MTIRRMKPGWWTTLRGTHLHFEPAPQPDEINYGGFLETTRDIETRVVSMSEALEMQREGKAIIMVMRVRRATVYADNHGEFRYRCQGGNWRVNGASEEGFKRQTTAVSRLLRTYPQTEELVLPGGTKLTGEPLAKLVKGYAK